MKIKIYQSFFESNQYAVLDNAFIPYNNLANENPDAREYPLILDLYSKNKDYDGYWGMVSWLFRYKTKLTGDPTGLTGERFIEMINENPGYDVYHFNPFPQIPKSYKNPFTHADEFHHPGMISYIDGLVSELGYKNFNTREVNFLPEHFIYCSYYIGNSKFWERWIVFLQTCMFVSEKNEELKNYLHGKTSNHNGFTNCYNFPFVMERLVALFAHLNANTIKTIGFTM